MDKIHIGGRIKIDLDGKLYVTTEDAANPDLMQKLNNLAGKMINFW
ncbi:PQQ-dependent sugar dehydrogenase [Halomonas sp. PAR8]